MRGLIAILLAFGCHSSTAKPDAVGTGGDGSIAACTPSGTCTAGPECGATCCGAGEQCVAGVCKCGTGPACPTGDTCESAGPSGENHCGVLCCGVTGPCPQ